MSPQDPAESRDAPPPAVEGEESLRPRSLAPHHLRLFGLMLDYLLAVALSKLLEQFFLGAEWDLHLPPAGEGHPWLIPLAAAGLLLLRDLPAGASPGRWFAGLTVRDAGHPERVPGSGRLLLRNLPLLLLPLEAVWVFVDPYYRRLGDRLAGTVVVVHPRQTAPLRRLMVLSILFLSSILVSFLVAHWSMRRSAAFPLAEAAIVSDPALQEKWGVPLDPGFSPDMSLSPDGQEGRLIFTVESPQGPFRVEVRLQRASGAPAWQVVTVEELPPPESP